MVGKYPVITLCGSTRFKEQFLEAQKRLTLEGNIVISVGLFGHSGDDEVWTEGTKEMLDDMHKRKIDMADAIYVINVGGYIGKSTWSEIEYAMNIGKEVLYLEVPEEGGGQITDTDIARVRAFIGTHEWHFAKTMPQIPHWYCLLKDNGDVEEFRWFAAYIREHSVQGRFYGKTYQYFRLDGYKYWWMDTTVEGCDLINRDEDRMYEAPDGLLYASYEAYCNDPDLDDHTVMLKLHAGSRTPQNDYERHLLQEMRDIEARGEQIDFSENIW